ncbi:MAG TPA: hypothetical protein VKP64_11910 [Mycobacteriales bacterium]|nr:hypothetical protein [Mycobacteriales bacterium]
MSVVPDDDPAQRRPQFVALGRSRDGVVSRGQAREYAVTRHVVRSAVRAGRWRVHGPRVIVLHTGPLTQRQRWWVAVLHAGPRAALCGLSALQARDCGATSRTACTSSSRTDPRSRDCPASAWSSP